MKLKATYETETFESQDGYYTIRQVNESGVPQLIRLSPVQLDLIAVDIRNALEDTSWWIDAIDEGEQHA